MTNTAAETETETEPTGLTYDKIVSYSQLPGGFGVYAGMDADALEICHRLADEGVVDWDVQTHDIPEQNLTEAQKELSFIGDYWSARTITTVTLRYRWNRARLVGREAA